MGIKKNQCIEIENEDIIDWTVVELKKVFKKGPKNYLWEKYYDWENGHTYQCTNCNGKESYIFIFKTNNIKKDSKKLAKIIYKKSKNYSGWRSLYMESDISGYLIELSGGWNDYCYPEPPKIINY